MSRPPFVAHDPKHVEPQKEHPRRAALTTVPDLRFEYGFIKSVRPYFRLRRETANNGKGKEKEADGHNATEPGDALEIQWRTVAWVATRDQVLSPLAQGALWAIAGYFLTPFYGQVRSIMPTPPEGGISKWLRRWVQSFGIASSPAPNSYTRP